VEPGGGDGPQDANGHGTHVSGIAAAITNNGVGVAGTAPDARILAVRVLDATGSGTADQIAAGIRYAADHGADVINLSLGFTSGVDKIAKVIGEVQPVYDAIDYAGTKGSVVAIAAGNDSFPYCAEPAGHPAVICVGSTDPSDLKSWFSNSDGAMQQNYVVAPGGAGTFFCEDDIVSTILRGSEGACSPQGGYDYLAGTSMATPFVSGVVALVASRHPEFSNAQIVDCVIHATDDLGTPGRDPLYGYGRINAAKAAAC
jgi:serine protease